MRVMIAGATSSFGGPLAEELRDAGHELVGLTRSPSKALYLEQRGVVPVVADVFDLETLVPAVMAAEPEAVVSLLITLPKNGPLRPSHVHPNLRLWSEGVPNLIRASREAGAGRLVAESFVFAYGYGQYGPKPLTERDEPTGGAAIDGQAEIIAGLRKMERAVIEAEGLEGIMLRYGGRHGTRVPMRRTMARALRCRLPVLPGGGHALLPFIEEGDSARAANAALLRGSGGEIYNIVDNAPVEMREYATALSRATGAPPPRSIPLGLIKLVAPYMACVLDHTRLPVSNEKAKRELNWAPRFATIHEAFAAGVG
jgi:nucleoside-diphosphate-sugar epimerase